ncbi:hypothetical protein J2X85_004235 [Microbacterium trichothecenolyticum]|uniref:hypothetical protein n=1 Tax=Microbacterium trichothecenolyticum TaxID=69370 RepID=UPI00285D340B|nr:hypothetical protein [Microbacterium trichothecenolyticum]MDR7187165.1 hypothetical protein [Microbacterium trichothecenolyticum]
MTKYFQFKQPQWFSIADSNDVWTTGADGRIVVSDPPPAGVPYLGVIPAGAILPVHDSDPGMSGYVNIVVPGQQEPLPWPIDEPDVGRLVPDAGPPVEIEVLDYPSGVERFPDTRWASQEDLDEWSDRDR